MVVVSYHNSQKVSRTETGIRECAAAETGLVMLPVQGMFGLGKPLNAIKWGLMGHPHRSLEDSVTESSVDLRRPNSRFQRGTVLDTAILVIF